jgi:hypothetical protein
MNGIQSMLPGVVGPLSSMGVEPLKQLFARAMSPGGASMGVPPLAILGAIEKASAAQKLRDAQAGGVAQMQAQQPTVAQQVVQQADQVEAAHGGAMQGYAGGGIVALQNGGLTFGYAPDYEMARKFGIDLSPYDPPEVRKQKIERARSMAKFEEERQSFGEIPTEASAAREALLKTAYADPARAKDVVMAPMAMRDTRGVTPETVAAAKRMGAPSGVAGLSTQKARPAPERTGLASLTSPVEATGTPAPDALSSIEAEARAQSEGLQKLLAAQGQVDPRIIAARKEAAELAQRTISEREKRAAGALEAAGLPISQRLLDNQEALLRLAGSLGGAKRFGEGLSKMAGEAGAVRGEQRKAFEAAQRENRLEQDAIDKLRQAQADLQLSQATGDVTGERGAALKVEEAKANLINTRLGIEKERALQADRAEGRQQAIRQMESQERIARENRAATAALRNLPTAEQQMAKQVMDDYMAKNPGKTLSDAWDFYRGAGKGLDQRAAALQERNELARQKLLESDMMYAGARMAYINATDPAKKAEALRKMKEIERLKGIVDEGETVSSAPTQLPPGVKVTRVGP